MMKPALFIVGPNGYLISKELDEISYLDMEKRFILAEKGEHPGYYHNGTFIKVDERLKGQTLTVVEDSCGQTVRVLDQNGSPVSFEEVRPFAYEKWGDLKIPSDYFVQPEMAETSMDDNILAQRM